MNQSLAITAIGADRPGIVNELTEVLLSAKLNIEDSRMSVLGGEFAIILLVTGDAESISNINNSKAKLEQSLNLNLLIKPTSDTSSNTAHIRYHIEVEGMDNPGIVHTLARYLSQQQINIVNMQTDSGHAPHTGSPMFNVYMLVDIPADKDIEQVKDEFSKECDALSMDVDFTAE
jgi:glycine cleavage system transcriptional repressor